MEDYNRNNMDPDQAAPLRVVWLGSHDLKYMYFGYTCMLQMKIAVDIFKTEVYWQDKVICQKYL